MSRLAANPAIGPASEAGYWLTTHYPPICAAGFKAQAMSTLFNFCTLGESAPFLKPLQVIGRVVELPRLGATLPAIGRKPAAP